MRYKKTEDGVTKDIELVPDPHQIVAFTARPDSTAVVVSCAGPHGLDEGPVVIAGSDRYDGSWDVSLGDGTPGLGPHQFLIDGPYTYDGFGGEWRPGA